MTAQSAREMLDGLTGKTAEKENFPVGSKLIPARLRPTVMAYYAYARRADDIADAPDLSKDIKLARLDAMDHAINGAAPLDEDMKLAAKARAAVLEKGVPLAFASDLLIAFKRDARNESCATWDDMMTYCRHSAMPVGRFLLALHGEDFTKTQSAGDALCAVHQALNHIQDCKRDYVGLKRVYVPTDWLSEQGLSVENLADAKTSPALRTVLNRGLDECQVLIDAARPLIPAVRNRGLRMETAAILSLAESLLVKLRTRDPLAERIELGRADFAAALGTSVIKGFFPS